MAVEDPSAIPAIFASIDDLLAREAEVLVESDISDEESTAFGRTLSFDWQTLRFRLDASGRSAVVSGQAALLEDIIKMLLTPRFHVGLYDGDYGSEFDELLGLPASVVTTQVEAMVRECLLVDDRISEVNILAVDVVNGSGCRVRLTVRDFNGELLDIPEVLIRYG